MHPAQSLTGRDGLGAISEGSYAFGTDGRTVAVAHEGWKLIHRLDDDGYELYDLAADPHERDDVFARFDREHAIVAPLLSRLQAFRDMQRLEPQPVGLTPEALERLRALGYIR